VIARGARDIGDDCPLLPSDRIDKAGFSGIRWARDHHTHAIFQGFDPRALKPSGQVGREIRAIAD